MYKKGFTLIELLVVVAIIGVLASVVISSLGAAKERAKVAKFQQVVTQLKSALELYYLDYGEYPSSLTGGVTLCGSNSLRSFSRVPVDQLVEYYPIRDIDTSLLSNPEFACLHLSTYPRDPDTYLQGIQNRITLYCPQDTDADFNPGNYLITFRTPRDGAIINPYFTRSFGPANFHCILGNF